MKINMEPSKIGGLEFLFNWMVLFRFHVNFQDLSVIFGFGKFRASATTRNLDLKI